MSCERGLDRLVRGFGSHPAGHGSIPRLGEFVGRRWRTYVRVEKKSPRLSYAKACCKARPNHTGVGAAMYG
jgi:hypothetical protein